MREKFGLASDINFKPKTFHSSLPIVSILEKLISMEVPNDYREFIISVKDRIRNAQYAALKAVNKELVGLYWDIGKMISEKQKELGWGKGVVENIAEDLKTEFPNHRGFSATNIWLMVQLYSEYQCNEKLQSLIGEIG